MLYVIVVAVALGFAGLLFAGLLSTNSAWLKKRLSQWNHPGGSETIPDRFRTLEEVQEELHRKGLEGSSLIVGIDYTKSNESSGRKHYNGRNLHAIAQDGQNPYEKVIDIIGRTLERFDDDKLIPVFGFGDVTTTDRAVFAFNECERPCHTFTEVLKRYREITPHVRLSGPTNFAPLIRKAVEIVKKEASYHILIIIADGQVTEVEETREAIVDASQFPLSIIMIGVGDGPFDLMREFDDHLPQRKFDNFQFCHYEAVTSHLVTRNPDACFAMNALMEIPDQYEAVVKLQLVSQLRRQARRRQQPPQDTE